MSVAESLANLESIAKLANGRVPVAATLAVTFGCPYEGQLPTDTLVDLAAHIVDFGAAQVGLADTAGLGHPLLVRDVVASVAKRLPGVSLRMHLHDTRGLGIANALAAYELGVTAFDTSLGGLGGCPVMQGASGNIATEDLVNLFNEMGIVTGVDVGGIRVASSRVQQFLGRELPSKVLHSGTRADLYAANRGS